ncbi:hypothetical protein ACFWPH_09880 [Nocardia sp. NPDC058499]|uniref:hypothetical protein n=1 Tax=Nocardia sp. NPDC058499 TaxID=3346530 RepID=UPI00366918C9
MNVTKTIHVNVTNGGAESSEALRGFGPSMRSARETMRRRREYRVLNAWTKGAKTPRAPARQYYGT